MPVTSEKAWRLKRRKQGLCRYCPRQLDRDASQCSACLFRYKIAQHLRRRARWENQRCMHCDDKPAFERHYCERHLKANARDVKALEDRRRARGCCTKCGKKLPPNASWRQCCDRSDAHRLMLAINGSA